VQYNVFELNGNNSANPYTNRQVSRVGINFTNGAGNTSQFNNVHSGYIGIAGNYPTNPDTSHNDSTINFSTATQNVNVI